MTNYESMCEKIKPLSMSLRDMAKYVPCNLCSYYKGSPVSKYCGIGTWRCFRGREEWLESEVENDKLRKDN